MNWLQRRNVWVSMGCAPPFAWRWIPHDPKRFMRARQGPYEGYRDRMSRNYQMEFNKIDRSSMYGASDSADNNGRTES